MRILATFLLAALFATAPAAAPAEPPLQDGKFLGEDTIVWRYGAEPPTLNPTTHRDVYGAYILYYINGYLYMLDKEKVELKPELAAEMPRMSEDKLEYIIPLRKDVKWSDGKPFTAHDVKASFDIMMHPKVDSERMRSYYVDIKEMVVVDDHTIKVVYSKPYYFSVYSFYDFPVVPKHVVDELDDWKDWNDVHQVPGCGPYNLAEWRKGEEIVLERNDNYFGEKPNIKRIRIKFIKDDTVAIQSMRRGEIDVMAVPPSNWERDLKNDEALMKEFQNLTYYTPRYFYIGWNCGRELFSSKHVRKALTYLLDIPDIIKVAYYGYGTQVTGPNYFQGKQYNQSVKPMPYDPEAAKKLLKQEGWTDTNGDGILDKNGKKFEFEFLITTQTPVAEKTATAMKTSFAKAGIIVNIRAVEWGAFLEELNQDRYDCCTLGWSWDWPENDPYQVWHSSQIQNRGSNRVKFNHPEADKLIVDARAEFDEKKRNVMYARLHEIIYDEQPYTFLYNPQSISLIQKRFKGVQTYPQGMQPRAGIEWWVPKGQEKYKK